MHMRPPLAVRMALAFDLRGDQDHASVAHAPLGDDLLGEPFHLGGLAATSMQLS